MKIKIFLAVFLFAAVLPGVALAGSGLEMNNYSEVVVQNLQIGTRYSMIQTANLPLEVSNLGDQKLSVRITVSKPSPKETKDGFEPIPDPTWVSITPTEVEIGPKKLYKSDVIITIPDNPKYFGKKFQADITVNQRADKTQAVMLAMAVGGRILITVASVKQQAGLDKKITMDFAVLPPIVVLGNVPVGKRYDILTSDKKDFMVENQGSEAKSFLLTSINPKDTVTSMLSDYEICPDVNFLKFKEEELSVPGNTKKAIYMYLEIPNQPQYRGKKYYFIASVTTTLRSGTRYIKILASTVK